MNQPSNPIVDWPACPVCGKRIVALAKRGIAPRVSERRFAIHLSSKADHPRCILDPLAYAELAERFAKLYTDGARLARIDARYIAEHEAPSAEGTEP